LHFFATSSQKVYTSSMPITLGEVILNFTMEYHSPPVNPDIQWMGLKYLSIMLGFYFWWEI